MMIMVATHLSCKTGQPMTSNTDSMQTPLALKYYQTTSYTHTKEYAE